MKYFKAALLYQLLELRPGNSSAQLQVFKNSEAAAACYRKRLVFVFVPSFGFPDSSWIALPFLILIFMIAQF